MGRAERVHDFGRASLDELLRSDAPPPPCGLGARCEVLGDSTRPSDVEGTLPRAMDVVKQRPIDSGRSAPNGLGRGALAL